MEALLRESKYDKDGTQIGLLIFPAGCGSRIKEDQTVESCQAENDKLQTQVDALVEQIQVLEERLKLKKKANGSSGGRRSKRHQVKKADSTKQAKSIFDNSCDAGTEFETRSSASSIDQSYEGHQQMDIEPPERSKSFTEGPTPPPSKGLLPPLSSIVLPRDNNRRQPVQSRQERAGSEWSSSKASGSKVPGENSFLRPFPVRQEEATDYRSQTIWYNNPPPTRSSPYHSAPYNYYPSPYYWNPPAPTSPYFQQSQEKYSVTEDGKKMKG